MRASDSTQLETAFDVFNEDNKRFKAEAEKRDLKIEYAQYIGYGVTSPTDKFVGERLYKAETKRRD